MRNLASLAGLAALARKGLVLVLAPLQPLAGAPVLVVDRTVHDFGRVPPGGVLHAAFQVRNDGDGPLRLGPVETSCGCTVAVPSRTLLEPGERMSLAVTYDPARDHGTVRRTVSILSDAPGCPRLDLELRAQVALPLALDPEAVAFRGILRGERAVREVAWSGPAPVALAPRDAPPWIRLEPGPPGSRGILRVEVDGSRLPGPSGMTRVRLATGDPRQPELSLDVHWTLGRAIQAEPESLAFDPGPPPLCRNLVLREARGRPFRIRGLECVPPLFVAEGIAGPAAARQEIRITFPRNGPPGLAMAILAIRTDHPGAPLLEVPLSAFRD